MDLACPHFDGYASPTDVRLGEPIFGRRERSRCSGDAWFLIAVSDVRPNETRALLINNDDNKLWLAHLKLQDSPISWHYHRKEGT